MSDEWRALIPVHPLLLLCPQAPGRAGLTGTPSRHQCCALVPVGPEAFLMGSLYTN